MDWKIGKWEFLADLFLVPVYALISILVANTFAEYSHNWWLWIALGWATWTFGEYAMHRWAFHDYFKLDHALHHRRPKEWIGVSSWLMGGIFLVLWVVMVSWTNGIGRGSMLFTGWLCGYYAYVSIHLMIHHTDWKIVAKLRNTHDMHHRGAGCNYGVSTNLWDHVFGTYLKPLGTS